MAERFCLKWNDFQTTVSQSFLSLRKEEDFFDVTLVSDDEVQIPAHKVVLSACSTFFKSILKTNKHSQPLIYLSGVNSMNLGFVLDYMYQGELNIYQDNLDAFLETAQKLKIAGLLANDNGQQHMIEDTEFVPEEEETFITDRTPAADDSKEVSLPGLKSRNPARTKYGTVAKVSLDSNEQSEVEVAEKVKELLTNGQNGLLTCNACGKSGTDKRNMRRHVETHIDGLSYPCQLCGKTFRSKHSLSNHKFNFHK